MQSSNANDRNKVIDEDRRGVAGRPVLSGLPRRVATRDVGRCRDPWGANRLVITTKKLR